MQNFQKIGSKLTEKSPKIIRSWLNIFNLTAGLIKQVNMTAGILLLYTPRPRSMNIVTCTRIRALMNGSRMSSDSGHACHTCVEWRDKKDMKKRLARRQTAHDTHGIIIVCFNGFIWPSYF